MRYFLTWILDSVWLVRYVFNIIFLLGLGIRLLSIDPHFMPAVHRRSSDLTMAACREQAPELTAAGSLRAVKAILEGNDS